MSSPATPTSSSGASPLFEQLDGQRPRCRHRGRVDRTTKPRSASATRCARSPTSRRRDCLASLDEYRGVLLAHLRSDAIARPTPSANTDVVGSGGARRPARRSAGRSADPRRAARRARRAHRPRRREARGAAPRQPHARREAAARATTCRFPNAAGTSCSSATPGPGKTTVARLLVAHLRRARRAEQGSPRRDRSQRTGVGLRRPDRDRRCRRS